MKDNLNKLEELIQKAIKEVPSDFACLEIKSSLNTALNKLQVLKNKRLDRLKKEQVRKQKLIENSYSQSVLDYINDEIKKQQLLLDKLNSDDGNKNDDDDYFFVLKG